MKKLIALLTVGMLAIASSSFAAVGVKVGTDPLGTATDFVFTGQVATNDGSTWTFPLVLSGTSNAVATSMTTTDTAVSTSAALVQKALGIQVGLAGTLANGSAGQTVTLFITERAGSGTFILTPTTATGFTSITFDAAEEYATFMFLNTTSGWILQSTNATINQ